MSDLNKALTELRQKVLTSVWDQFVSPPQPKRVNDFGLMNQLIQEREDNLRLLGKITVMAEKYIEQVTYLFSSEMFVRMDVSKIVPLLEKLCEKLGRVDEVQLGHSMCLAVNGTYMHAWNQLSFLKIRGVEGGTDLNVTRIKENSYDKHIFSPFYLLSGVQFFELKEPSTLNELRKEHTNGWLLNAADLVAVLRNNHEYVQAGNSFSWLALGADYLGGGALALTLTSSTIKLVEIPDKIPAGTRLVKAHKLILPD